MKYIIQDRNQQQLGPITEATIENLFNDGVLDRQSTVFNSTSGGWVSFESAFGDRAWLKSRPVKVEVLASATEEINLTKATTQPATARATTFISGYEGMAGVPETSNKGFHIPKPGKSFGWIFSILLLILVPITSFNHNKFINFLYCFIISLIVTVLLRSPYFVLIKYISKKMSVLLTAVLWVIIFGSIAGWGMYLNHQNEMAWKEINDTSNLVPTRFNNWLNVSLPKGMSEKLEGADTEHCVSNRTFSGIDHKIEATLSLYEMKSGVKFDIDAGIRSQEQGLDSIFGVGGWSEVANTPVQYGRGVGKELIIKGQKNNECMSMHTVLLSFPVQKGIPDRGVVLVIVGKFSGRTSHQIYEICRSITYLDNARG
ncbi:hypothetical protein [Geothrix fuzhouensis]|uniref:hypothetical protein n=1 Tax=Geothrix fuzhouensis TaxID=2966451 RepID=UPI0021489732|nr:hypothetical protein [Geothrix fuzhouensis]